LKYCRSTAKKIVDLEKATGGRKSLIFILLDMIWCNLRYGAMDSRDYLLFEFWKKSASERNKFFTKRRYFRLIKSFDKKTFLHPGGKSFLYKKYADFIKRDWMLADNNTEDNTISEFFAKHDRVLVKPLSSEQGRGIHIAKGNDIKEILDICKESKQNPFLLEEVCGNCDELNRINKSSLNTLRIFTIVNDKCEIEIPSVTLRCGVGEAVVDNWGAGGVSYPVDLKNGVVYERGVDKQGTHYIYHPGTEIVMPGYVIPRFKEALEMARQIIRKDMNVVYAGLDIAILPDRLELIELNFPGGHDIFQAIDHIGKNEIIKHLYQMK